MVNPVGDLHLCRDPDDDAVLETAILGHAQYLVTRDDDIKGDNALISIMRSRGVEVLTVQRFLAQLQDVEP